MGHNLSDDAAAIAAASLASVLADLNRAHFRRGMSSGMLAETARELYETALKAVQGAWEEEGKERKSTQEGSVMPF